MIKLVNKLKDYFDPPQGGTIEYEHYIRTGDCNNCGKCCSGIYLVHNEEVIKTVEHFDKLKLRHEDYQHFIPLEETELGVQFKCRHLTAENTCGIYHDRPLFCKKYPSESTLIMGGALSPDCSYQFTAKYKFDELLKKASNKKNLKPGKLLNDVTTTPPV